MKQQKCVKCGKSAKSYVWIDELNGDVCDECAGVKRDKKNHAWLSDETHHAMVDMRTGEISIVTREEAFK